MNADRANPRLDELLRRAPLASVGVLALAGLLALSAPGAFFAGYLGAFWFWWELSLGLAAVLMLHHLTGGRWGADLRPVLVAGMVTVPLLPVLFVPILIGLSWLYPWAATDSSSHLLASKRAYLNVPFFIVRACFFFGIWLVVHGLLYRAALRSAYAYRPGLAAAGLVLYFLTVTFATIDWIGSLQYEWYSTILGLYVTTSQSTAAFALAILATLWGQRPPMTTMSQEILADVSTLLLAFMILHAYMAYSQFFIIWNANLPHEIAWYVPRLSGGWKPFVIALIVVDFVVPLVALLSRQAKRSARVMTWVCLAVLAARVMEAAWFVLPVYEGSIAGATFFMAVSFAGIGGAWMAAFIWVWRSPRSARRMTPVEAA